MATITSYATLTQALQDWFARTDVSGYTDYFIQIAENRIYYDILNQNEGRGIRQMETALSGTISTNTMAVPADYLGLKIAYIVSGGLSYTMERTNTEFIYSKYPAQSAQDIPAFIARDGSNFIFGPYPDQGYTISGIYWNKAAALSSTNTTTWMTSTIPHILLAACAAAMAEFVQDDGKLTVWNTFYQQGLQSFINADKMESYSGSSLQVRAG